MFFFKIIITFDQKQLIRSAAFLLFAVLFSGCVAPDLKKDGAAEDVNLKTQQDRYLTNRSIEGEIERAISGLPVYKLRKKKQKTVAVQVLLFDCKNFEEVEEKIIRLKESGINTLIFRAFHNRFDRYYAFANAEYESGVYFKTDKAPVVDDILERIVKISHDNGLQIYAWMTTKYANYGAANKPSWRAMKYDFDEGDIIPSKGLNIFNGEVRNYLTGLFMDLAAYDVDGILFQDDMVLRHTEGFSVDAIDSFAILTGSAPDPDLFYEGLSQTGEGRWKVGNYGPSFWQWSRWKNRSLLNLAKEIMAGVRIVKPRMKFAINLMYEAALSPTNALAWLSQDMDETVKAGFDFYAIMAYHRQMGKELDISGPELEARLAQLVENATQIVDDPDKLMIKLQVMDWKSGSVIPVEEVNTMLDIVLKRGIENLAFVPYKQSFEFEKMILSH